MALLPHVRVWATLGLVCASLLLCLPPQVSAVAINQTIDDNDPAVRYLPTDRWALNSNCSACVLKPSSFDLSKVYDGTWHDGTASQNDPLLNLSFSFTGTAIYLFGIVVNNVPDVDTRESYYFTLDGQHNSSYVHPSDSTTDISYNVSVYSVSGLANTQHEVVMITEALALFDYAIYTQDDGIESPFSNSASASSPSSNSLSPSHSSTPIYTPGQAVQTPLGPIVGGIVGGLAAVFLPLAVCWYRRRHRRPGLIVKKRREEEPIIPSVDIETEPQLPSGTRATSPAGGPHSATTGSAAYLQQLESEVQLLRATVSPPAYIDATSPAESTPAAVDAPAYDEAGGSQHEAGRPLAERSISPARPGKQAQKLLWKSEKPRRNLQH